MATGEQMPSCDRLVATATIGRPRRARGVLGDVDGLAAADADDRVVARRSRSFGAELDGGVEGAAGDR